jgi:hypothetical protein
MGSLTFHPDFPNRRTDVTTSGFLAKAFAATLLVALMSLAWNRPAQAHPGHGPAGPQAAVVTGQPEAARATPGTASAAAETADICAVSPGGVTAPSDCPRGESAAGRTCCGTMCTAVLAQQDLAVLPRRVPHGIRLGWPPEQDSLVRDPGLHARPPRTIDIA